MYDVLGYKIYADEIPVIVCLALFVVSIAVVVIVKIIRDALKSPFSYPYFDKHFDISRKRTPKMQNYIDRFLLDGGAVMINAHCKRVADWKDNCEHVITRSRLKKLRTKQYNECVDDERMFRFYFDRTYTTYKQINYVRHPYRSTIETDVFSCSYNYLSTRCRQLQSLPETNKDAFASSNTDHFDMENLL